MLFEVKERHQYSRKKGFIKKIVNLLNENYEKYFIEDLCNYLAIQSLDISDEERKYLQRKWLGSYDIFADLYKQHNLNTKEITAQLKRFRKLVNYIDYDSEKNVLTFNFGFLDKTIDVYTLIFNKEKVVIGKNTDEKEKVENNNFISVQDKILIQTTSPTITNPEDIDDENINVTTNEEQKNITDNIKNELSKTEKWRQAVVRMIFKNNGFNIRKKNNLTIMIKDNTIIIMDDKGKLDMKIGTIQTDNVDEQNLNT
jgi:hypothetical protein